MRNIGLCLLAAICAIEIGIAAPREFGDIQVTRWVDPQGRTPLSYQQYILQHPLRPLRVQRLISPQSATDQTPFVILVNPALYPQISASITTYMSDLIDDDFSVMLVQWGGGTPEQVRDSLISWYENGLCDGAVIIGDLPIPWFELYEDFNDDGIPDNPEMVDFPCDLFYMDLNGTWDDLDQDGIYDVHEGNTDAEIWIGQLRASTLTWSEAERINNYFAKDHAYRQGNLILPSLALNYIDDDWAGGAMTWGDALRTAFGAVITFNDINETTAEGYLIQLHEGYSCVQVATHSSPFVHSFKENNGSSWGYIQNWEIRNNDPQGFFYNLFACSNCRYVETDYMGGWYIFAQTYGLGAIGSTKTGAMLYFEDYYPILANMGTFGEALAHWISLHGNIPGHQMWSRSWFYGMTHLGDPTLRIPLNLRFASMLIDDDSVGVSRGDHDGVFDAGEIIELSVQVENPMSTVCSDVSLIISTEDTLLTLTSDSSHVASIPAEGAGTFGGFVIQSHQLTPDGHTALVNMVLSDNQGHAWYDSFELGVAAPSPVCVAYQITEIEGNGNGWADPGETIALNVLTHNNGSETVRNLVADAVVLSGDVSLIDHRVEFGNIDPGSETYSQIPFSLTVESTHPAQQAVQLKIEYSINDVQISEGVLAVPMSSGYNATFTFETADPSLRSYAINDSYRNAWHWSTQYAYSGIGSEKFGDIGAGNYPPMADGAVEFPLFPIGANATLTIYHKIDAEIGYDGGIVEVNSGEGWTLLHPTTGYPYSAGNNGSFPAYSPCFSGQSDWSEATFQLPNAAGFTKIRFRFGSDGGVEGLGWYLDDVTFYSPSVFVSQAPDGDIMPEHLVLLPAYPNPFNVSTKLEFVIPAGLIAEAKLELFNVLGQKVTTLWHGTTAGTHTIIWSGTDSDGRAIGSGVYFLRLKSPELSDTRKLVMLR